MQLKDVGYYSISNVDPGSIVGYSMSNRLNFGLIVSRKSNSGPNTKWLVPFEIGPQSPLGAEPMHPLSQVASLTVIVFHDAKFMPILSGSIILNKDVPKLSLSCKQLFLSTRNDWYQYHFSVDTGLEAESEPSPAVVFNNWSLKGRDINEQWVDIYSK